MGKPLPVELRQHVVAFVEEGHTPGCCGAVPGFHQIRQRQGAAKAQDRVA
jgi:hypothetical protein